MKEQSDMPSWWRCDTHGPGTRTAWGCPECVRELRTSLATATRERDEAQAEGVEQARLMGISGSREAALLAKVDAITRERDEARAEVEKLRSTFVHCHVRGSSGDLCAVCGLDLRDKVHTAATEAARKFCGVWELERAGYIPAGSADERET